MGLYDLVSSGVVSIAILPACNDFLLNSRGRELRNRLVASQDTSTYHEMPSDERLRYLDMAKLGELDGYTVPLIAHDYGAMTPAMWNSLYESLGLNVRNIMVVGNPRDTEEILQTLKSDARYLGGGAGVGFKESVLPFVTKRPEDLQSVNIVVRSGGKLFGYNTDAEGFIISLEEKLQSIGKSLGESNFAMFGAGGVAKEVGRSLGLKGASSLAIINRTINKAVALANQLGQEHPRMDSYAVPEYLSRGIVLNSTVHPDALINTTDKGSDRFKSYAFYMPVDGSNETLSRSLLRYLKQLTPDLIISDIVIPSGGRESISLRLARAEGFSNDNLLDGIPMVVNQAGPAYKFIQDAHPTLHPRTVSVDEAIQIFKKSLKPKQS